MKYFLLFALSLPFVFTSYSQSGDCKPDVSQHDDFEGVSYTGYGGSILKSKILSDNNDNVYLYLFKGVPDSKPDTIMYSIQLTVTTHMSKSDYESGAADNYKANKGDQFMIKVSSKVLKFVAIDAGANSKEFMGDVVISSTWACYVNRDDIDALKNETIEKLRTSRQEFEIKEKMSTAIRKRFSCL